VAQRSSAHAALGRAVRRLRIERGEKNPSYEKLMDLASALDVRISELIAEADDR